jgi:hypothetical protein
LNLDPITMKDIAERCPVAVRLQLRKQQSVAKRLDRVAISQKAQPDNFSNERSASDRLLVLEWPVLAVLQKNKRNALEFRNIIDVQPTNLFTTAQRRLGEKWTPIQRVVDDDRTTLQAVLFALTARPWFLRKNPAQVLRSKNGAGIASPGDGLCA